MTLIEQQIEDSKKIDWDLIDMEYPYTVHGLQRIDNTWYFIVGGGDVYHIMWIGCNVCNERVGDMLSKHIDHDRLILRRKEDNSISMEVQWWLSNTLLRDEPRNITTILSHHPTFIPTNIQNRQFCNNDIHHGDAEIVAEMMEEVTYPFVVVMNHEYMMPVEYIKFQLSEL